MRGLLVANPNATTTSPRIRDVLVQALAHAVDLEVVTTTHAGHAGELGERARREGMEIVVTLGGDGTIHEVVNGMLAEGPGPDVPALATVPGGSANVFARACGLGNDPVEATGRLLEVIKARQTHAIGLGRANGLWFTCNAGLGLDAEIIADMEAQRAKGKKAGPTRYLMTTLRHYFMHTDRKAPALTLHLPDEDEVPGVFLTIVQNTRPWTYMGGLAVNACPQASFDSGLDLWAIRTLRVLPSLRWTRRLLMSSKAGSAGEGLLSLHDLDDFTVTSERPVALQVDGEGLGDVDRVRFEAVPDALRAYIYAV